MFWDKVAGVYDVFADVYNGKVNRVMCRVVSEQIGKEDRVLECACGTGLITTCIAPLCKEVVATDFSEGLRWIFFVSAVISLPRCTAKNQSGLS